MQFPKNLLLTALCFPLIWLHAEETALDEEKDNSSNEEIALCPPPPLPEREEIVDPKPVQRINNGEFEVNLKDPVFSNGVIRTEHGGVITGSAMRVQAKTIEYTNKIEDGLPVQKIVAEGDLLLEYDGQAFVGSKLEYDFISKTGTLLDGKTFSKIWFVGGDKITLNADGSYFIYNAYITTCESKDDIDWDVNAKKVKISKDQTLSANNIRFRFVKLPIFWLPTFKTSLKAFDDTPVKYKLTWDKSLGPRGTMRYKVYGWENFNLFFRLDYRLKKGFGAALESDYFSEDLRTFLLTKSYGAHDKEVPDERGPRRYRLQGLYHTQTLDQKTVIDMTYDKFSDDKMPGDFKSDDFEINTQKRTILTVNHTRDNIFANLRVQPQINSFQSINQELPLITAGARPFEVGSSGIISQNYANVGYLDYVYVRPIRHYLHNRHSFRAETNNYLFRPTPIGPVTLNPYAGFIGIYYSNNQKHHDVGQAVFAYGGEVNTHFYRSYSKTKHLLEPYISYTGYTDPLDHKHYIFNIDDGYAKINMLEIGARNSLYSRKYYKFSPTVIADFYTRAFFDEPAFHRTFPKAYSDLGWNISNVAFRTGLCWNIQEHLLDYSNVRTDWTVNENVALGVEFRHRSKYDWRKADHENFVVDVTRPISALLHSPMSDGRNTFLSRCFIRVTPLWSLNFQSHTGWGRRNQPAYNSFKLDVFRLVSTSWRARLSYQHTPNDDRFTGSISMVK